jgi:transposase
MMTSEEVLMPTTKAPYPPDFRSEAVRLAKRGDRSVRQTARDLGVSYETLRHWVKQSELDAGERHDGLTTEEREELRRLRRENRMLKEEKEILIKAAAFFAKETDSRRPGHSS